MEMDYKLTRTKRSGCSRRSSIGCRRIGSSAAVRKCARLRRLWGLSGHRSVSSIYEGGIELEAQPGIRAPAGRAEGVEQQDEVHVRPVWPERVGQARSRDCLRAVRDQDGGERAGLD